MTTLNTPAITAPTKALLGTKPGMTRIWNEDGILRPVAVVRIDTNVMTQIHTIGTDSYEAVQLASGDIDASKVTKSFVGYFARVGIESRRHVAGTRISLVSEFTPGQELAADTLEVGQLVDVTGTSKDEGLVGAMKRHGFVGVGASRGAHRSHRKPGPIGARATPGRIPEGLRMAGRIGHVHCTVQNLKTRGIDVDKDILLVNGVIPDPRGSIAVARAVVKGV